MENRFGIKDLVICFLICVVIVLVILGMVQYDRQWQLVKQTNDQINSLTSDIAHIRRTLDQGGAPATGNSVAGTQPQSRPSVSMAGFERNLWAQSQPDYAQGDTMVQVLVNPPDKLTPLINSDFESMEMQTYVMDSLVGRDPNTYAWIPDIAESWSISDDQLSMDFKLRRGVTFSDGSPLTADDVIFTFQWMLNPAVECPRLRAYLDKLKSFEKINDYEVKFTFKELYFKSFEVVSGQQILSRKFYSKYSPTDFNRSTGLLIGSGPYRLPDPTTWRPEPGKPLELIRNERYWGPAPAFNRLVWRVIQNPSARVTAFRNGDFDFYTSMAPDPYEKLSHEPEILKRTSHYAMNTPMDGYEYIGWNQVQGRDGPPSRFADVRVRRALTMLMDRDAMCRDILKGYASVIAGPFSSLSPQCDPNVKPMPYDPAAAAKLLADAGYIRRGDQLFAPDGKPFEFKLMYPTHSTVAPRVVSAIKDSFAQVGIIVDPDPQEWSVFLKRADDRQFEAVLSGWSGTIEDDPTQIFTTAQIAGTGDNFVHYSNPKLDALIEKARSVMDDSKRMVMWKQVFDIIHDDAPYSFLFAVKELSFIDSRIHGVRPTKLGFTAPIPAEWYTPKTLQKYTE